MQTIIEQMVAAMDAIKADINKTEKKQPRPEFARILLFLRSLARLIVRKPARNNQDSISTEEVAVTLTYHLFYVYSFNRHLAEANLSILRIVYRTILRHLRVFPHSTRR